MSITLLGIGTAVPPHRLDQGVAARMAIDCLGLSAEAARSVAVLYRRTQAKTRSSVLIRPEPEGCGMHWFYPPHPEGQPGTAQRMLRYRNEAPPLAESACRLALSGAAHTLPGLSAKDITHLVVVSCTGFFAPGMDYELIVRLGLSSTIERYSIGFMGCHGGFNGLQLATALVAAHPDAKVLLCCTELCSLHFQYSPEPGQITANALFADGSGAVVIGSAAPEAGWSWVRSGSCLIQDSHEDMSWQIGDHGFEMFLSTRVPGLIRQNLADWLIPWLSVQGLNLADITHWAVHPGGPRILTAVAEALNLKETDLAASRQVLKHHGNMSSATVWFILDALKRAKAQGLCLLLGFGPGLVAEAALLEL
ncbi:MAG: type III polyketide synthase [Methylococcaceae bacterium]